MAPRVRTSRKILVASLGVATMSYVISCGGQTTTGNGDAQVDGTDEFPVANLVGRPDSGPPIDDAPVGNLGVMPDSGPPTDGPKHDTIDDFPVANLVANPG